MKGTRLVTTATRATSTSACRTAATHAADGRIQSQSLRDRDVSPPGGVGQVADGGQPVGDAGGAPDADGYWVVEECDDGNTDNNDGCSSNCFEERCGDGIRQSDEGCDDGNDDNHDACRNVCQVARCGDGVVRNDLAPDHEDFEICDDGNRDETDDCYDDCTPRGVRRRNPRRRRGL